MGGFLTLALVVLQAVARTPDATAAARETGLVQSVQPAKNLKILPTSTADPQGCAERIAQGRRSLAISPQDAELQLALARSLTRCGQYAEAVARYRQFVQVYPQAEGVLVELGDTLRRARRECEAIAVFRKVLELNANDSGATLGLAQALAATGNYPEALLRYDEFLKASPENYDGLQGKAYVLYWTHEFAQARALFRSLQAQRPDDSQNAATLEAINRAEEERRWLAARPPPNAPPQDFVRYYQERLAYYPRDAEAMMGLAHARTRLGNFSAAIETYRRLLEAYPDDRDAKLGLARTLSWDSRYEAAIQVYREVLKGTSDDVAVREELAHVYVWSGRLEQAAQVYQELLVRNPFNAAFQVELARLEVRLKDYAAAREILASLLASNPSNHQARLLLAQLDLRQGDLESALKQFDLLLKQNPRDPDALYGHAQVSYYQGDLREAHETATMLVKEQPDDFDALFLLAAIERAQRDRRGASALLERADRLSRGNPEVAAMKDRLREESSVTLHTSIVYAREIGRPASEDLRAFSAGTMLEFHVLPKTDGSFSLSYLPSNSPFGAIGGAVGPAEFLYRQTTRLSSLLMLRGGAGLARFGPGTPLDLISVHSTLASGLQNTSLVRLGPGELQTLLAPTARVPSATTTPIAYVGFSAFPTRRISFDLNATRSAIIYTPASVRLGVVESHIDGSVNFLFDSRTELHLSYFAGSFISKPFAHVSLNIVGVFNPVTTVTGITRRADRDHGQGGFVVFNRNLVRSDRFSFDAGYSGLAEGYEGHRRSLFLGFFNPGLYQRHLLTTHLRGRLWGPLGYDFSSGFGLQQVEQRQALARALTLSPAFSWKVSPGLSLALGYTYYNSAQTLGTLRGNAVKFSTDFRF